MAWHDVTYFLLGIVGVLMFTLRANINSLSTEFQLLTLKYYHTHKKNRDVL